MILKRVIRASVGVGLICGAGASIAETERLSIQTILSQPEVEPPLTPPRLVIANDQLVTLQYFSGQVAIFDSKAQSAELRSTMFIGGGGVSVNVDSETGQGAVCHNSGNSVSVFKLNQASLDKTFSFPRDQHNNCFGIAFGPKKKDGSKDLLVSSTGSQKFLQLNTETGWIDRIVVPFVGVHQMLVHGNTLFGMNSMPLVLNLDSLKVLAGHPTGDARFARGLGYNFRFTGAISEASNQIFYVNKNSAELLAFDLDNPLPRGNQVVKLGLENPYMVAAHKSCLVVSAMRPGVGTYRPRPIFSVLRWNGKDRSWNEVERLDFRHRAELNLAYEMRTDSHGNLYVASTNGLHRIQNLLPDELCAN